MLVVFEGMDGVGKTTIARDVAKKIGFNYDTKRIVSSLNLNMDTYLDFIKSLRESDSKDASFMFFTFKCLFDKISGENLVTERTMASTYFFEKNNIPVENFDFVMNMNVKPDITFLLYASPEERIKRIRSRNAFDPDLLCDELFTDGYPDMINFLEKYNMPYVLIDTEKYNKEQVSIIAQNIIGEYQKCSPKDRNTIISSFKNRYGQISMPYVKRMVLS